MSLDQLHNEWLSLIEISGPFLAVPVLKEVFPQGLEELEGIKRKRLRQAYDEWREAWETDDPQFPDLHRAWITALVREYYDPMYAYQRESRRDRIVFEGDERAVLDYLRGRAAPGGS